MWKDLPSSLPVPVIMENPAQTPEGPCLSGSGSLISPLVKLLCSPSLPPSCLPARPLRAQPPCSSAHWTRTPGGGPARVWHLLVRRRTCLARSHKGPSSTWDAMRLDPGAQKGRPPRRALLKLGPPPSHPAHRPWGAQVTVSLQQRKWLPSEMTCPRSKEREKLWSAWKRRFPLCSPLCIPVGRSRGSESCAVPTPAPPTGCLWNEAWLRSLRLQALPLTVRSQPFLMASSFFFF